MDKFIKSLSDDLKPCKPMKHPLLCLSCWFVPVTVFVAGVLWYYGLRRDIDEQMGNPVFLFEIGLALVTFMSAILATFYLRVPDMRGNRVPLYLTYIGAGIFTVWFLCRAVVNGLGWDGFAFHHCMMDGPLMMIVPAVLTFLAVMKGCTTHPKLMVFTNIVAICSLVFMLLHLTCKNSQTDHLVFMHILPFCLVAGVIGLLARRFYRW